MSESAKDFLKRKMKDSATEAIRCVKALDPDKVFFYADPLYERKTFDYGPLYRFAEVDLFIYAGREGTQNGMQESLQFIHEATPVGLQLKECNIKSRFLWPEQNKPENLSIHEMFPQTNPPLADPDWAIMTKLLRQRGGEKHEFWLLCIGGNSVDEYRRLFNFRGAAPKYLAFGGFIREQAFLNVEWAGPLAEAVQANAQAEPQFIVTDEFVKFGKLTWAWAKPWIQFNSWKRFQAYALPARHRQQVQADAAHWERKVVIQQCSLTPETVGDAEAVVITPELHRQWQWPKKLKLIILANNDYRPDARTLRINGDQHWATPLACKQMEVALRELDRLCGMMNVQLVASVQLGFEDEGPVIRQWRQQAGVIQKLTFHLDLPGNVEAFGPYADEIHP
jgi:hypothetical protein